MITKFRDNVPPVRLYLVNLKRWILENQAFIFSEKALESGVILDTESPGQYFKDDEIHFGTLSTNPDSKGIWIAARYVRRRITSNRRDQLFISIFISTGSGDPDESYDKSTVYLEAICSGLDSEIPENLSLELTKGWPVNVAEKLRGKCRPTLVLNVISDGDPDDPAADLSRRGGVVPSLRLEFTVRLEPKRTLIQ